jgi:hypothetical protein
VKAAAPRSDPIVRNILYLVGGLIVVGVGFNVLSGMGLVNGVGQPAARAAESGFSATGNISTHIENSPQGKRKDVADLSGTVTNNSAHACSKTTIVGTLLDRNSAVVAIKVATSVATDAGQTANWNASVPYVAQTNTVTRINWAALCSDSR